MAGRNDLPAAANNPSPGMIDSLRFMLQAITEYIVVRFELAGLESKDALQKVIKALIALVVILLCLAAGFLYLSLSLIYVLAVKAAWGWGWALSASGLVMFVVVIIALFWAKSVLQGLWFPITTTELKKDIAWLKSTPNA